MIDLSKTYLLTFEIGSECNLTKQHSKCPINKRKYKCTSYGSLRVDDIIRLIDEAMDLGFHGYIAFHYYNEPLLYRDKIEKVMDKRPDCKYLLWTNGLLFSRNIQDNEIIQRMSQVVITCYDKANMPFFMGLKKHYNNIEIQEWELDERLVIYEETYKNELGCKKVQFEFPIDFYGNVHLCCYDWNNEYELGNVFKNGLTEIVESSRYQNLLSQCKNRLLDYKVCPDICTRCRYPWIWKVLEVE